MQIKIMMGIGDLALGFDFRALGVAILYKSCRETRKIEILIVRAEKLNRKHYTAILSVLVSDLSLPHRGFFFFFFMILFNSAKSFKTDRTESDSA